LWVSQFSSASTLGGRSLVKSRFYSLESNLAAAEADIFAEVIKHEWHGLQAMPDAEFAKMEADLAVEHNA
jgi:hypothetical protein